MKVHMLDRRRIPARRMRRSPGAAALLMLLSLLRFATPVYSDSAAETPPPAPERRELWVPTDQLKEVLSRFPKAVLMTREQYEALARDANLEHKDALPAPRKAVLESAEYHGHLAGKVAQVTATLKINVLSDEWAHLPLNFDGVSIGAVTVDGEAALAAPNPAVSGAARSQSKAPNMPGTGAGSLLVRGKGERSVTVEFTIPVSLEAGVSSFQIKLPPAAANAFSLDLPGGQNVESPQPVAVKKSPDSTTITATIAPANPILSLSWRALKGGDQSLLPVVTAEGSYEIDSEKITAQYDFDLKVALGSLPESATIDLPPNVKTLQATGAEVAQWEMAGNNLLIHFQPGERAEAKLHVVLEAPALGAAGSAVLALPIPHFEKTARFQGTLSIIGDEGVTIKDVATDASLQAVPIGKQTPHFVGAYSFSTVPGAPRVTVEKLRARFSADLDSSVEFKQDAVFIERTITLHPEKGEVFDAAVNLPEGEEALTVRDSEGAEPDWHIDGRRITLRWTHIPHTGLIFKITTRIEPGKWSQIDADGIPFTLNDARIENAERVTGYIALKADDAFRLEAEPSDNLERRDGRTTPVKGDYAWFRGADFTLRVKVAKRPGEVLANLTGYALPLEGVLDLNAEINYDFLRSGVKSVRIRVPKDIAANFYFDGPQIAERNLNGDVWTIVFQKALTGAYRMKVTGQVTVERKAAHDPAEGDQSSQPDAEKESRFEITVPQITPLDVARTSGVWAVEANTETEITFAAKGMNELDSLLAPKLSGYQPRHRVIGVFAWLGGEYSLTLSGVRHAPATVLTSVVDQLNLDTVVSASGVERNQAVFKLRTAGAQYLDVELPEKSRLLSLSVDGDLVKPVGDRPNRVRVQLPAKHDSRGLAVSVLYETPKASWGGAGGYAIHAPKLGKSIPILSSEWRVYLPDGFEYTSLDSNLGMPPPPQEERPLLSELLDFRKFSPVIRQMGLPEPPPFSATADGLVADKSEGSHSEPDASDHPLPFAKTVPGKPGFVFSPFAPNAGYIDVRGFPPGTEIKDPYSGRSFIIPAAGSANPAAAQEMQEKVDNASKLPNIRWGDALNNGDEAVKAKDYEKATAYYKQACDNIPQAPPTQRVYAEALHKFCKVSCDLAEQRITEGRYADAEATLRIVLDPRYDPHFKRAVVILARLEQPDYYNKTTGPQFRGNVEQVKQLFIEAQGFFDSGRFDLANKRCDQILAIDKYNIAARKMQAKIDRAESDYGVEGYNETRASAMNRLDLSWAKPVRRYEKKPAPEEGVVMNRTVRIQDKLEKIIIPKLEFKEATIQEAVDFLKKKSVELDTNSPQGEKGTNIVLKLGPEYHPEDAKITVTLTNIPLIEALRYVTNLASLKFKVEPFAVLVVQQSVSTDVLLTKEYKFRGEIIPKGQTAKDWLISIGVLFTNPGASAALLPGSGRLIVRNTQDQLELIDTIQASNSEGAAGNPAGNPAGDPIRPDDESERVPRKRKKNGSNDPLREKIQRKLDSIIIPKLDFREATLREAVDFLKKKSVELDTDSPADDKGTGIILKLESGAAAPITGQSAAEPLPTSAAPAGVNPPDARITVSLTNVPLSEALRYVTNLAGMKYKIEAHGITIVPQSVNTDILLTREWRVRSDFLPQTDGIGIVREAAKNWLISYGVQFNGGAEAVFYAPVGRQKMSLGATGATSVFLPAFGRLVVKNTEEQLDLIETIMQNGDIAVSDEQLQGGLRVSGLLPMKLNLPKMGRMMVFDGFVAADRVEFRYEDWWSRARRLWAYFVIGGFGCLVIARHHPWRRTGWAMLILSFFPFIFAASAMSVCNALLAGWLVSVIIQRLAVRLVFAPRRKVALA